MMTKKYRIIAFAGRKRSGKGMLAQGIKNRFQNAVILSFADNLKQLCAELLNTSSDNLNKMKNDGTTFSEKIDDRWVSIISETTGINEEIIRDELGEHTFRTVREMLQVLGTNLIRKHAINWHVDKMIERINEIGEDKIIVVDDVRFNNEKDALEKIGADVFIVIRPNCFDVSNHPSETELSYEKFKYDKVIINDLPKDEMINLFNTYYFVNNENKRSKSILLSENPWYVQEVMNTETNDADHLIISTVVLEQNIYRPLFQNHGIITFSSNDNKLLSMFRRIILNNKCGSDNRKEYSIYNPLTNEILKKCM